MKEPIWPTVELVLEMHDAAIQDNGGTPGVLSLDMLESALARPRHKFLYEQSTIAELAASLCYGLVKNHAFRDGNHRTALLATASFLWVNGYMLQPPSGAMAETLRAVSSGALDEAGLAAFIEAQAAPPDPWMDEPWTAEETRIIDNAIAQADAERLEPANVKP